MRLVWILLMLSSVASADEQLVAPSRSTCKPNGAVWLELIESNTAPGAPNTTTQLFANGTVQVTRRVSTTRSVSMPRCIDPAEMEDIAALLKSASWKTVEVKRKVPCKTSSTRATAIKVFGKLVFTERACSPRALEPKSADAYEKLLLHVPDESPMNDCDYNPLARGCI